MDQETKRLRNKWYQKLKNQGFEDIEDVDSPREMLKCWHSRYFLLRYSPAIISETQEYYQMAQDFYDVFQFKDHTEKEIWLYHIDGHSAYEIARRIEKSHDVVNRIVRKLEGLMRLGF